MPVIESLTSTDDLTMTFVAEIDAPVERVWDAYARRQQAERFWGPPGWPVTFTDFDFAVGGRANYLMNGSSGEVSPGGWEMVRIDDGREFEMLVFVNGENGEHLEGVDPIRMTFTFEATPRGTRMTNVCHFATEHAMAQMVAMGIPEGCRQAIDQLDAVVLGIRTYAGGKPTRTDILDDRRVRFTRVIEGPRQAVWSAHHNAELLGRWLYEQDGWVMTECIVGENVGERFLCVWQREDTPEITFGLEGECLLMDRPRRAVTTQARMGTGVPGVINDLQFYEEDGATLITRIITHVDTTARDAYVDAGEVNRMESAYTRLEELIDADSSSRSH